jgi:site-specific recombinase XerD
MKGNMKEQKKSKAKNLTDAICRSLPRLDKRYMKPADYPGLEFWIMPGGTKSWFYQYRIKGVKDPIRKKIGTYPVVGVVEATNRAKKINKDIYDGTDPRQTEKVEVLKEQLGPAIKRYYTEELTEVNNYRPATIKGVKAIFGPWIFRNTYVKDILTRLERAEDLQYKKLSMITPKMVKELYHVVGARSPIVANRLVEYLRMFWNDFVKADDNPFLLLNKFKYEEKEYLDYLDETELQRVMSNAVKIDERSGRLLESHYKSNRLSPVSCMAIALLLTTGRRTVTEVTSIKWENYKTTGVKRLELKKTKTSKKNKIVSFKLGDEAVNILNHISVDRLNNPKSAFYYPIGDERNNFIFPSKDYGRLIGNKKKGTSLHLIDCSKTWNKLLKMSGVDRQMKLYATRHTFATNFYKQTQDIKAGAEALAVSEKTFLKYAKLMSNTVIEGTNKIKFFADKKPTLVAVPKVAKVIE